MGFKDAEWAYTLDADSPPKLKLATSLKVVLAAIAHATDDKTHQTYVSQKTLAGMVGMSKATVNRAIRDLERLGVVTRARRNGAGGYRTTDIITLNLAYIAPANVAETNVGQTNVGEPYIGESAYLHNSDASPTSTSATAEEINQLDQPEDQPDVGAQKRGTRIPDDFTVTPSMIAWAREHTPLVDSPRSTEKFLDHWRAATGRNATKKDWTAAWRNWLRTDQERAEERAARNQKKPTPSERARSTLALVQKLPQGLKEIS